MTRVKIGSRFMDPEYGQEYEVCELNAWLGDDKWYARAVLPPVETRREPLYGGGERIHYTHPERISVSGAYVESCWDDARKKGCEWCECGFEMNGRGNHELHNYNDSAAWIEQHACGSEL